MRMATRRLAAALVFAAVAGTAAGQHLYKCGGTYQDRPCADQDAQKRFAHGRFEVDQANPDTDRDCVRTVSEVLPFWKRLHAGESPDTLRSQIDAKSITSKQKDEMRELLASLRELDGSTPSARSQLETQCMAAHRRASETTTAARSRRAQHDDSQAAATPPDTGQKRR